MDTEAYWDALANLATGHVMGGQVYDGLTAAAARSAGGSELLTLNPRHFAAFAGPDLEIVDPSFP